MVAVAAVVGSGAALAVRQIPSPSALLDTRYGNLLTGKIALVGVVLALGALAHAWVRRHCEGGARVPGRAVSMPGAAPSGTQVRTLRRRLGAEASLGIGVLALSTALVAAEPARALLTRADPAVAAAAQAAGMAAAVPASSGIPPGVMDFDAGGTDGQGRVQLVVQPARVGAALLHLTLTDRQGRPRAVAEAQVAFSLPAQKVGPLRVVLTPSGTGHYTALIGLPMAGRWEVGVTIRTSEVDRTTVTVPLVVAP